MKTFIYSIFISIRIMKRKNIFGIISLILGILGILFYVKLFITISLHILLIPDKYAYLMVFMVFSIIPIGIFAIIFGVIQIKRRKTNSGKTGLILGIITLVLVFLSMFISMLKYIP